jgi:hypothetical protein
MFIVKLELAGGFKTELPPMDESTLLGMFDNGMMGSRPYAIIVNEVEVDWSTFKTIFNLGILATYRPA